MADENEKSVELSPEELETVAEENEKLLEELEKDDKAAEEQSKKDAVSLSTKDAESKKDTESKAGDQASKAGDEASKTGEVQSQITNKESQKVEGSIAGKDTQLSSQVEGQEEDKNEPMVGRLDENTLKQLEAIEREINEITEIIDNLKTRIRDLLGKETMTDVEAKEFEEKNIELKNHLEFFEAKTKLLQSIINKANVLGSMPERLPQRRHEEDVLPSVILCGAIEDNVPKIVFCKQKLKCKGKRPEQASSSPQNKIYDDKFYMADKLVADKSELEEIKLKLETDMHSKDKILEDLQMKLDNLQNELTSITKENAFLSEKIKRIEMKQAKHVPCEMKKICPAVVNEKLKAYSEYTHHLEKQLEDMEKDFLNMKLDIYNAKKKRCGQK